MEVSLLTQKEVKAHDLLIHLTGAIIKLSPQGREKVYKRWMMLRMMLPEDIAWFRRLIARVDAPIDEPTKLVISKGGSSLV